MPFNLMACLAGVYIIREQALIQQIISPMMHFKRWLEGFLIKSYALIAEPTPPFVGDDEHTSQRECSVSVNRSVLVHQCMLRVRVPGVVAYL